MSEHENSGRSHVVVGLDNHCQPAGLLSVAADEAERRGADLAVVTVLRTRLDPRQDILGIRHDQHQAEAIALQNLHAAAASVHRSHPQLGVTTHCLGDGEVGADRQPLLRAELLVIGTRSHHGAQALALESVSRLLLTSSHCPLLIVPDAPLMAPADGSGQAPPILVGVSEHPTELEVVRAAFAESVRRGSEVRLLHAYSLRPGETAAQGAERARGVLAGFAAQGPAPAGTPVSLVVTEEAPAPALLSRAGHAALLVIGGRTGSLSGLVRGSVSREVLATVPCPILAVPRDLAEVHPGPPAGLTDVHVDDHEPAPSPPAS